MQQLGGLFKYQRNRCLSILELKNKYTIFNKPFCVEICFFIGGSFREFTNSFYS